MAKLEFPANPTTGQQYTGTNGVIYQWDSAKWQTRIVQSYVNTGANPGTTPPSQSKSRYILVGFGSRSTLHLVH
jgi:hypothetical protein